MEFERHAGRIEERGFVERVLLNANLYCTLALAACPFKGKTSSLLNGWSRQVAAVVVQKV
jgi:hypothetical protein